MGIVYHATDLELHRDVAIKVLPDRVSEPDAPERFLREARAAAALNHPNIVAVHDVGEELGIPFFVMELVQGRSLGQELVYRFTKIRCYCTRLCNPNRHLVVGRVQESLQKAKRSSKPIPAPISQNA